MSPRMRVERQVRVLWGVRLGSWMFWVTLVPQGPRFACGQIAATDTPRDSAPGKESAVDAQGRILIVAGVAFAVLRGRSVRLRKGPT